MTQMETDTQGRLIPDDTSCTVQAQNSLNKSRPIFGQAVVASLVYLTATCNGLTSGYSAVLLPQIRANSTDFYVDENIESWIVSIYIGATSVGCLLSGVVMDLGGRRLTVQISLACICVGWIVIAVSSSYPLMLVGRALGGFGKGFSSPAITFHVEEMADPRLRGALSACILLTYSIGIMLISLMGTSVSWQIAAGLGAAIAFVDLVGYSLLHESPVWLVRNNRISQATQVFSWLWGGGREIEVERDLQELMRRIKEENSEVASTKNSTLGIVSKCRQYLRPQVIKPFLIIHFYNIIQIVCGTNLFIFYTMDIVSGLKPDGTLDVHLTVNLTSIIRVVSMAVSCVILIWIGRRAMCISSGVGSGIAAMVVGTLVYMENVNSWAIIVVVMIYVAFNTYGYFVLPPAMIGELLPSKIRCIAGAYIFTMNDVGMFIATKAFYVVARNVGVHGLFWIFGASSLLCAFVLYLLLPETKGRSLVQIEEYFLQPNILWHTRKKENVKQNVVI